MIDLTFVDTNVLVYGRDAGQAGKQERAAAWVDHLWRSASGRLSYQVLNEFYVTVTRKLKPGMDKDLARRDVDDLLAWNPLPTNRVVLEGARLLEDRYGLSWWDALIVSAAQVSGCSVLLTEDLQDGQVFGAVTVVNPFERPAPASG